MVRPRSAPLTDLVTADAARHPGGSTDSDPIGTPAGAAIGTPAGAEARDRTGTPAGAATGTPTRNRTGAPARDPAIDVLRGLCIVSMTTAHLAAGSWPWQIAHAAVFVDGAVGFVLLSGVVVGMTQRRTIDRAGLPTGQRRLLRRTGVIYLANLVLCLAGTLLVAIDPARAQGIYAGIDTLGGPLSAAVATLTLQVNPYYTSILSLYVVLLLLAIGAVAGLARRRPGTVVAGSLALYVAGWLWPTVFTFTSRPGVPGAVNWATWQLLFVAALLVGWYWRAAPMRHAVFGRVLPRVGAVVVLVAAVIGWVVIRGTGSPWREVVTQVFSEGSLAPATIVMAFAAVLVGYRVCRLLVRVAGWLAAPIARIGRHSLDCYLILSLVVIAAPSVLRYGPSSPTAVGVTVAVLVVMLGWCLLRDLLATRAGSSR
ncbi:MAG TPA: OpgC domain-containing protein [Nakamurella sp.]